MNCAILTTLLSGRAAYGEAIRSSLRRPYCYWDIIVPFRDFFGRDVHGCVLQCRERGR